MYQRLFYKDVFDFSKKLKVIKNNKEKRLDIYYKDGYSGYVKIYKDLYEKNSLELSYLYIEKEFRKQGIGTELMKQLCKYADENNYRIVLIPYKIDSTPKTKLIKFYKKFGFKQDETEMFRKPRKIVVDNFKRRI